MISTLVDLLGNFYISNDFTNVEAIARSIHAAIPSDQVSLQFLGLVYYRTGRVKEAIRVFNKVLGRRKPAPQKDLSQGDSAAAVCYREATRHNPDLAQVWYDLGATLLNLRKVELALPAFRNALIARPDFTPALLAVGGAALRVGDIATAKDGFSRLRELQPNNGKAYSGLGQVYRKCRDFATARACFVRARMLRDGCANIDNLTSSRRVA
jgi:Flp pilus assembly protein TadD